MPQLDFSLVPNYGSRQMFLDPAGGVTIQRYDDYAFPKIAEYEDIQKGAFWRPEEISLTRDKIDFKEASGAVRHIFTSNLLRQTMLDSIQGRSPVQIFTPVASIPEMEAWVQTWSFFETIHSKSYSHIIRNIYNVPVEQFNSIHGNPEIVAMASGIAKYYNRLHELNSKIALHEEAKLKGAPQAVIDFLYVSEYEHLKAIWMALIASYGLEAIRFMVSFATSLGMVENRIFIGNGNIISLILQDEMLHKDATAWLINTLPKVDPRFRQIKEECKKEAFEALVSVVDEEKQWAKYQFREGPVIGLNEPTMISFVDYNAQNALKEIDFTYKAGVKTSPYPWFNKHLNTNKKQTALQENESVAYVIGSMTGDINYDELPDL